MPFPQRENGSVGAYLRGGVVHREGGRWRNLLHLQERGAAVGIGLPMDIDCIQNLPKTFVEALPLAVFPQGVPEAAGQKPGLFPSRFLGLSDDKRVPGEVTGAGHGKVAHGIMVRGFVLIGTVTPAEPVAVFVPVQRHAVIVEKIGRTGACAAVPQTGFSHNSIAFSQRPAVVNLPGHGVPGFSAQDVEQLEPSFSGRLELCLVAGFV